MSLIGKQNHLVSVLEANAVGTTEIVSNSITASEIAANAVGSHYHWPERLKLQMDSARIYESYDLRFELFLQQYIFATRNLLRCLLL